MNAPNSFVRAACLYLAVTALTARAAGIISINLLNGTRNTMFAGDAAGAPGVRTTNWNNATGSGSAAVTLPDGTIINNLGAVVSGLSVTITPSSSFSDRAAGTTNESKMFNCVIDKNPGAEGTVFVQGIPFANYLVYFYVLPDSGGAGIDNARGGYFAITNFIVNPDSTITIDAQKYWLKGGPDNGTLLATPNNSGVGYVQSRTSVQPTNFAGIQAGHYVVFNNQTNSSFTTYINVVGGGNGGVAGGNSAQRMKWSGFQIVEVPSAAVTSLSLASPMPNFLAGSSTPFAVSVLANTAAGDSYPVAQLPGVTYTSQNTNVFAVDSFGTISSAHAGVTNLVVKFGALSLTQSVTVLAPITARLSLNPTNVFLGNGVSDKVQARLFADYAGGSNNVDVTTFNYVTFGGSPASVVTVTSNGLVSAVATGSFNLTASIDGVGTSSNSIGQVVAFLAPGGVNAISVDISDAANVAGFKDLSGAPGARVAYWNGLVLSGNPTSNQISNPTDSRGNIQTGTVITVTANGQGTGNATPLTTNEARIFRSYYDAGLNNPSSTFVQERLIAVTNVPYTLYDAYFYCYNDTAALNRPGHFTVTGTGETRWRINSATLPGGTGNITPNETTGDGYLEAVPILVGGSIPNGVYPFDLAHVPAGNFVKFTGLTNRDMIVLWGAESVDNVGDMGTTTTRMRIAGFQIVKNLSNLTPTNLFLQSPVPGLLPGNPVGTRLTVLANFTDGTAGGNITSMAGYSSASPSIFTVDVNGILTGLVPGTANLVISYKTLSLTQAVTVLAPVAVRVNARPDTAYLDSLLGPGSAQGIVFADFLGQTNVNVTAFTGVVFNDLSPAVASVGTTGFISPLNYGKANLGVTYLGVNWTNLNAFTVLSVTNVPTLKHRYSFREAPGSTVIVDSVGSANGTLYPPLGANLPITLDGDRAVFPGDADYTTAPYIALPGGLISERGDVTLEAWAGYTKVANFMRIFDFGSSAKGNDPHASGNGIDHVIFAPVWSDGYSRAEVLFSAGADAIMNPIGTTLSISNEHHIVIVYSPNTGTAKLYLDGTNAFTSAPTLLLSQFRDDHGWLGMSEYNDPTLGGWISELRIHEGAFTDQMVADSFAAGPNAGIALPPKLSVSLSGANLQISWPLTASDYTLKSNTVLNTTWYPVGINRTTNGSTLTVTVPVKGSASFFILQK